VPVQGPYLHSCVFDDVLCLYNDGSSDSDDCVHDCKLMMSAAVMAAVTLMTVYMIAS